MVHSVIAPALILFISCSFGITIASNHLLGQKNYLRDDQGNYKNIFNIVDNFDSVSNDTDSTLQIMTNQQIYNTSRDVQSPNIAIVTVRNNANQTFQFPNSDLSLRVLNGKADRISVPLVSLPVLTSLKPNQTRIIRLPLLQIENGTIIPLKQGNYIAEVTSLGLNKSQRISVNASFTVR